MGAQAPRGFESHPRRQEPSAFRGSAGPTTGDSEPEFLQERRDIDGKESRPFLDEHDYEYQVRQAITGALATLTTQHRILSDWKLLNDELLDPEYRSDWQDNGQKKFLLKDSRFLDAYHATEIAFGAIALINPKNVYNDLREEALAKIERAETELDAALARLPKTG